jgi:ligand-binding sensor domain-containing protein
MEKRAYLVFWGMVWGVLAWAQPYTWMSYSHPALYGNSVQSTALASDNTLWIGTSNGLINKRLGVVYSADNSPMPDSDVRSVGVDADGRVWVGMFGGGLAIQDGGAWTVVNTSNSALPDDFVRCFLFRHDTTWVGTAGGLVRMVGDSISAVFTMENSVLESDNITDLEADAEGVVWVATVNGGLTRFAYDESARSFTIANSGILDNSIFGLSMDSQQNKWLATPYGGLHILSSGGVWVIAQTENSPMPTNSLFSVVWDAEWGSVVGTQDTGVVVVQGNTFERWNGSNSPLGSSVGRVNTLTVQHDTVWIGTSQGGLYGVYRSYSSVSDVIGGGVSVYPNPVLDRVQVVCDDEILSVQVYTLQGDWVAGYTLPNGSRSATLPIATWLPKGWYVLWVSVQGSGSLARRIHSTYMVKN